MDGKRRFNLTDEPWIPVASGRISLHTLDSRAWQNQFKGKHVFAEGKDGVALSVVKKNEVTDPSTQCDAVTGATLTCNGVSDMLKNCLGEYTKFLTSK